MPPARPSIASQLAGGKQGSDRETLPWFSFVTYQLTVSCISKTSSWHCACLQLLCDSWITIKLSYPRVQRITFSDAPRRWGDGWPPLRLDSGSNCLGSSKPNGIEITPGHTISEGSVAQSRCLTNRTPAGVAGCEYCTWRASFCVSFGVSLGVVKLISPSCKPTYRLELWSPFPAMLSLALACGRPEAPRRPQTSASFQLRGSGNEQ